jgi:hypothetical protein
VPAPTRTDTKAGLGAVDDVRLANRQAGPSRQRFGGSEIDRDRPGSVPALRAQCRRRHRCAGDRRNRESSRPRGAPFPH